MNQSLTIVLPMFNRERQVRSSVMDILELSPTLHAAIEVVVVDDGSTDDTYETACELSRAYPQVTVLRQSVRRGLRAAIDLVRRRLNVEIVVVHDGVSSVDASKLKAVVESPPQSEAALRQSMMRPATTGDSAGSRRFASIRTLHDKMERAHRSVTGFYRLQLEKPMVPRRRATSSEPSAVNTHNYLLTLPIAGTPPTAT